VEIPFNILGLQLDPPNAPYLWEIGDVGIIGFTPFWHLTPNPIDINCIVIIPAFSLPIDNTDFGSAHGVVKIRDNANNISLSADPTPNKKVQVFFKKNDPNYWNPQEPN
jgi:hypothetical protein